MKIKILVLGILSSFLLVGCGEQTAKKEPEISIVEGSYMIDVYSYAALAGDADYVMIGKVVEESGTDYKWPTMLENEAGSESEFSIPYTNYSVEVVENLKGELSQETTVQIAKCGGLTKDNDLWVIFDSDTLPTVGNEYIFYIYVQDDGSYQVSGPNSSIPLNGEVADEISTMTLQENEDGGTILDKVRDGVANPIESERPKHTSKDEISLK